jgi:hypothetical protein
MHYIHEEGLVVPSGVVTASSTDEPNMWIVGDPPDSIGSVSVSATGEVLIDGVPQGQPALEDVDISSLIRSYRLAMTKDKDNNWLRGDIAQVIVEEEKKKKGTIKSFLQATGEDRTTFDSRQWVASKFPRGENSLRNLPLNWSMFRIAAGTEDPKKWLTESVDNNWTTRQLMSALKEEKTEKLTSSNSLKCSCGCDKTLQSKPIYVGNLEKDIKYFDTPECLLSYYNKYIVGNSSKEEDDKVESLQRLDPHDDIILTI